MTAVLPDVMCCAKCGGALRIVCDQHGTEFVPDRRMAPTVELPTRRRKGVIRSRVLAAFIGSGAHTVPLLAARTGLTQAHTSVELTKLVRDGDVRRIARGHYVRST